MGQSIKSWIGLAALAAVLIIIAGWFLVISPTRATTAETRANIESEQNRTLSLTKVRDTLRAQFLTLDDSRAELADLTVQMPTTADDAAFRRVIEQRVASSGVTLLTLATGVSATVVEPAATADDTATDTTGDSTTATPSPSAAAEEPAAVTTAVTTTSGQILVGIPLDMTVVGTYQAARDFLASLQVTEGRLFLVSALNVIAQTESPAGGGRPETVTGDVELSIQGFLLVLTPGAEDVTVADPTATPTPTPSPEPLPSTERNPFPPVAPAAPAA